MKKEVKWCRRSGGESYIVSFNQSKNIHTKVIATVAAKGNAKVTKWW